MRGWRLWIALWVVVGSAGVAVAQSDPARDCAYALCRDECIAEQQEFFDRCLFCEEGSGNCDQGTCQQEFKGCIPGELCPLIYEEFVGFACSRDGQSGCIHDKLLSEPQCQCPTIASSCVDECADAKLNDCDANATCTDTDVAFECTCNAGYAGDGWECEVDADEDGDPASSDCDDTNAERYNGASEVCDGIDNDCDNVVDNDAVDTDADGVCDALDACPADNPDDTDGDGVCDSDDLCEGDDALGCADAGMMDAAVSEDAGSGPTTRSGGNESGVTCAVSAAGHGQGPAMGLGLLVAFGLLIRRRRHR